MTGWVFGNAVLPTRVRLEGSEPPVTEPERARVFWLLRRYTSLAYVERQPKIARDVRFDAARQVFTVDEDSIAVEDQGG